ncbi:MAG: arginine repressor [Clostridiales bacterium]|nr:arginine repressor [Clostridiales bacterium]MBP3940301.1 arginine repressor [Christensenellaceae bacterium]MBR2223884.1 arginine repressor [Christensenellaceae bacterium]MBR3843348.1 arginine repressor [Christensenellaceae bacterium]
MKGNRQSAILEIIENNNVETQEELAGHLLERGFKVTQATISRDIKELHLIKIQDEKGFYRYSVNEIVPVVNTERLLRVFRETVINVQSAGNMIVVTTLSGSANAAAEVLDNMNIDGVVGSLAGDNTIFIVVKDNAAAHTVAGRLRQMTK